MARIVLRTYNIPAGRLGRPKSKAAVRKALDGADVVVFQEVEEIRHWMRTIPGWGAAFYNKANHPELVIMWRKAKIERVRRFLVFSSNTKWGFNLGLRLRVRGTNKTFRVFDIHTPARSRLSPIRTRIFNKTVARLIEFNDGVKEPVFYGGDWNANPNNDKIRPFYREGYSRAVGGKTHGGKSAIDFFIFKNATLLRAKVFPHWAGDHRCMQAIFRI